MTAPFCGNLNRLLMNPGAMNRISCCLLILALLPHNPALAQSSAAELARKAQNPVADLISVPFQLNWNFDAGPLEKDQQIEFHCRWGEPV